MQYRGAVPGADVAADADAEVERWKEVRAEPGYEGRAPLQCWSKGPICFAPEEAVLRIMFTSLPPGGRRRLYGTVDKAAEGNRGGARRGWGWHWASETLRACSVSAVRRCCRPRLKVIGQPVVSNCGNDEGNRVDRAGPRSAKRRLLGFLMGPRIERH